MTTAATPICQESTKTSRFLMSALQVVGASLILGFCAHIKIPLFFTPIPLAMSTLAVLLIGTFLGSRKGVLSVLLYLAWGTLGLPVFASGPASFTHIIGPSGGYLLGYVLQAYLAGWLLNRQTSMNWLTTFSTLVLCCAVQMGMGVLWLSKFVGWENVMVMGFVPFIPGEILKSLIAAGVVLKKSHN